MDQPNDDLTALLSATGIGAQACADSAAELLRLMDNDPKNLTKPDTIAACHAFAQSICEQMAAERLRRSRGPVPCMGGFDLSRRYSLPELTRTTT